MIWEDFTLQIPGLEREYTFLHISDAHAAVLSDLDDEADRALVPKEIKKWQWGEKTPAEMLEAALKQADEEGLDGVILAGDCVDFASTGQADWLLQLIRQTKTPVYYCFGNHEGGHYEKPNPGRAAYPLFAGYMGNPAFQAWDFGTFLLLAVDDSDHQITDEQLGCLEEQLGKNKPVILIQHAPFFTPQLLPEVEKVWGKDGGEYFLFAKGKDRAANKNVAAYYKRVTEKSSPVIAAVAGHVHFAHIGPLGEHAVQLVSGSAYSGYGRRIHLVRKNVC